MTTWTIALLGGVLIAAGVLAGFGSRMGNGCKTVRENLAMKQTNTVAVLFAMLALPACVGTPTAQVPEVMNAVTPEPGIVAAGRLNPEDIARLQNAGIRHVIDLTPDAETPDFDEAKAVRSGGMDYSNLPIAGPADLTRENALAFDEMLRKAQRPLLVHCASANRVGALAALRAAWIEGRSVEEAVSIGKAWGLKSLEPQVRERIEASK